MSGSGRYTRATTSSGLQTSTPWHSPGGPLCDTCPTLWSLQKVVEALDPMNRCQLPTPWNLDQACLLEEGVLSAGKKIKEVHAIAREVTLQNQEGLGGVAV